uniref:diacylglycerol kinase (ATP) n=1 Tax=Romanomermis culicivorax TaxID=13658 RepID=A0A915IID9_ROMCU
MDVPGTGTGASAAISVTGRRIRRKMTTSMCLFYAILVHADLVSESLSLLHVLCNFTCHEKCLKTVASYCSGVAMQLIKNPVAHCWSEPSRVKKKFCCVCRRRTDDSLTVECEDCLDLAVSDCKEAATYVPNADAVSVHHHHWREGNLPQSSKCANCRKTCWSAECLAGMRCEWCGLTAHAICYRQLSQECDFGALRRIVLPPNCLTIPRTELPMEQLLSMKRKDKENSSPIKGDEPSFSSPNSDEMGKDKDDCTFLFSFNDSLKFQISSQIFRRERQNIRRTCVVPKNATLQQITNTVSLKIRYFCWHKAEQLIVFGVKREIALRTFHIRNPTASYCITQVIPEDGSEEMLEENFPIRVAQRRAEGKRVQLFLRYKDVEQDKTTLKVYGGWLRIPVTFCTIVLDHDITVETVIKDSLARFGLGSACFDLYNLVEVSLDRGIVERTLEMDEHMLQVVKVLRNDSLKRFQLTRYYLQEKEDPHGSNVSLFVGNLPPSLAQRKYERILLRLLGAEVRPFTAIGPIYYEYGSLVITFNSPKAATKASLKLQKAAYEDKKLLVLCLPNIQPHMVPSDVEPLMVLVNVKSGGCQGLELIRSFRKLLNPFQVFDILNGGPLVGLYVFRNIPKYRILVCGGDGTVGWVLQCLDIVGQDSVCSSPPCGVVPLGTGNDLARVLRWGSGYTGQEDPLQILKDVCDAEEIKLDR